MDKGDGYLSPLERLSHCWAKFQEQWPSTTGGLLTPGHKLTIRNKQHEVFGSLARRICSVCQMKSKSKSKSKAALFTLYFQIGHIGCT